MHKTHYEKADWSRVFNQYTILCEVDMMKCKLKLIAELAERSPIIIQNSSNPSSRKNLDVRPYDRTRRYF